MNPTALSMLAVFGYALAFYFLSQSLKYIPLGVAYAIWSGRGTVGSALLGLLIWNDILGPVHILGIALIVVGVVVLNVVPST
jgi:multidrug transporter EmrE-like cation transporter